MGVTSWYASGVMGPRRSGAGPHVSDDKPMSRADKWSLALFVFGFLVVPIIAAIVIAWAMITAPPQDNSWCARWVSGHCAERADAN